MTAAAKTRWSWRPACPVSVGIWLAVVVLAFPLVPGAQAQSPYETPPVMKVTDLAPAGLISKKLTHVAWVTFSAREAVNLTTAVVMPYSMVMSTVSLTNNLIWDMKPADLVAPNQKKATDMGAGDEAASALIANKNYSISALTALMTALERLGPIPGRADVVDYVVWTANVANFARRPDFAATSRDIWLTRRMSPRARHEFERIGWRVHEGSRQPSRTEEFAP